MNPTAELTHLAVPFVLVLTRLTGLVIGLPDLLNQMAPATIKALVVASLALAFTLGLPPIVVPENLAIAMVFESLVGIGLGLVVRMSLVAAEFAADMAGTQMGFGIARMTDPLTREDRSALSSLIGMVAVGLLFVSGMYLDILRGLAASFELMPAGTAAIDGRWAAFLAKSVGAIFVTGVRLALPLVFAVFSSQIAFGLMGRVAPQLNVWALGFLITMGAGLVCVALYSPFLVVAMNHHLAQGLHNMLRLLGVH